MTQAFVRRRPGHQYMSLDDFEELMLDKPEVEKWELINGRVIRGTVGARWEHSVIISNLDLAISNHLRATGKPCRTFRESFFLKGRSIDLSALPDLLVRCGPLPPGAAPCDDPIVLIEIVSPSSEARDRLEKRVAYQALASLQTYVLVERDRMLIDVYERTEAGFLGAAPLDRPEQVLKLSAIGFELPLSEVYRDVFPAA